MTEYNIRLNPNCASVVHTGLKFKAGDKGIIFKIAVDEMDTTGTTAKIVFQRSNGTSVESDITGTDGTYTYKTLGNEFAVPGKTVADVKFYASGNRESTASFVFEVCGDTMNGLGAGTAGYSDRLEQLVAEAEAAEAKNIKAQEELETTEEEMAAVLQKFKEQYGAVGALNPRGNWNGSVSYAIRDLVYYEGFTWVCLVANKGVAPTTDSGAWIKHTDFDYSNENLLINPDFKDPVNSSGKTEWTAASAYIIDKWILDSNLVNGVIATVVDEGIQIDFNTEVSAGYGGLRQNVAKLEKGNKYKLSASIDGVIYSTTITGGYDISGGVIIGTNIKVFYLAFDGYDSLYIRNMSAYGSAVYNWVKLEPGSIATPFIQPNKEVEKLKCGATGFVKGNGEYFVSGETILSWALNPNGVYHKSFAGGIVPSDAPFDGEGHVELLLVNSRYTVRCTQFLGSNVFLRDIFRDAWYNGWHKPKAGDADTVDGIHASYLYNKVVKSFTNNTVDPNTTELAEIRTTHVNCPTSDVPYIIKTTFTDSTADMYERRQTAYGGSGRNVVYNRAKVYNGSWSNWKKVAHADEVLPLDGSVPMSGALKITLANNNFEVRPQVDSNSFIGGTNGKENTDSGYASGYLAIKLGEEIAKRLGFIANGTTYTVLHTGNSQKVLSGTSAPSDTTALWYDTTNKILKRYVDGAWQA